MNTIIFAIALCVNPSPNTTTCELVNHTEFATLEACETRLHEWFNQKGLDEFKKNGLDYFCAKKEVPAWHRAE